MDFVRAVPNLLLQDADSLHLLALELLPWNSLVQPRVPDPHAVCLPKDLLCNTYYLRISRLGVGLCIVTLTGKLLKIKQCGRSCKNKMRPPTKIRYRILSQLVLVNWLDTLLNLLVQGNDHLRDWLALDWLAPVRLVVVGVDDEDEWVVLLAVWLEGLDVFFPSVAVDVSDVEDWRLWELLDVRSELVNELHLLRVGEGNDEGSDVLSGQGAIGFLGQLWEVADLVGVDEVLELVLVFEVALVLDAVAVTDDDELGLVRLDRANAILALELLEVLVFKVVSVEHEVDVLLLSSGLFTALLLGVEGELWLDHSLDPGKKSVLVAGALVVDDLAVKEQLDRWITTNAILSAETAVRSAVDLADLDVVEALREFLPVWSEGLAVAAPWREELDELAWVLVEGFLCKGDHLARENRQY